MSYTFIQELQEAAIKFLGTVPAASLHDEEEDNEANPIGALGDVEQPKLDSGQEGDQAGEFDPEEGLDPDLEDEAAEDPINGTPEEELAPEEPEDPDRMGDIRSVKGAHLVFKRQNNDGSFTELWIYNIGKHINDTLTIKRAILAGTDIPEGKLRSEDGKQIYTLSTLGNAQMLSIDGLSN